MTKSERIRLLLGLIIVGTALVVGLLAFGAGRVSKRAPKKNKGVTMVINNNGNKIVFPPLVKFINITNLNGITVDHVMCGNVRVGTLIRGGIKGEEFLPCRGVEIGERV